ncbi:hypothetical protein Hte_009371 [Hypoxylon texense]
MTTWQQVLLWFLIIIGSSIWVSIWTVLVRKHAFEARFEEIVRKEHKRRLERRNTSLNFLPITHRLRSLGRSRTVPNSADAASPGDQPPPTSSTLDRDVRGSKLPVISRPSDGRLLSTIIPPQQEASPLVGEISGAPHQRSPPSAAGEVRRDNRGSTGNAEHVAFVDDIRAEARSTSIALSSIPTHRHLPSTETAGSQGDRRGGRNNYLREHKVGRNGQFHGLTSEEREELGGTEYRALKLLSIVVPLYWFLWQFLGCISLGAWLASKQPQPALDNAISPWWNGIFNGVSAFNNSGMSVLDLNMIPYGSSYFVLIVMGAMILAGNTAYPIFLRSILWGSLKLLRLATYPQDFVDWKDTLEYILKYPRRVYTNLFPSRQTYWLVFMLFMLNGTDWVAFEVLNFGNSALDQIPLGSRIIDGLFQALGKAQPSSHETC